jgi:hypothetical protein
MTISKCTARKVFTLTHDANSNREFILATNSHSDAFQGVELDSLDLGDAMGYWMSVLEGAEWSGDNDTGDMAIVTPDGICITIGYEWEPFQWVGKRDDPDYLSDTRGDGYHDE